MKKFLSILLALTLMLSALAIPALADTFVSNNVQLSPVRAEFLDFGGNDVSLRIYMRVVNNNSFPITVLVQDVEVNGVKVGDTAISDIKAGEDTGVDSREYFLFKPEYTSDSAAAEALRSARTVKMKFQCYNKDTYQDLFIDTFTIDVGEIGDIESTDYSDRYTDDSCDDSNSYDYGSNTAPAYTPASYDFQTLKKGSKGQAVKDLQQRLTDLGYLNDKIDGSLGLNTIVAIRSFQDQNGLNICNEASPEMQRLLYSSNAKYHVMPYIPLVIGPEYKAWQYNKGDLDGHLQIQVVNRCDRKIIGFELYYYKTDVWGNQQIVNGAPFTQRSTFQETVEGGYRQYTSPIFIMDWAWTYTVWAGIHKIVFDDGEIREIPEDEIDYYRFDLKY